MTVGQKIHGFEIVEVRDLGELKATGIFARHAVTGLEVFHVLNDDDENLFAYAFMTPPEDSTGVAHILEHSVLCGSRNYPLKDPFLVLSKQSVKTFLNAMTFPDKTVYPASSMVEADYFNLMSVYGDAVFFPLLEEWIFRQEGHRFEFAPDGSASIQGVVFNEMRGDYSSFDSIAGDWSRRSLLEGTPYAHDSGGDPADIPALTYERFREFHAKYYHPSNCKVFLHGNIPTERQLELLESRFLSGFGPSPRPAPFGSVKSFAEPVSINVPAPAGEENDLTKSTVTLNWLLPDSVDTVALMEANLVSEILLGHDGAPLSRALLESGLGEDIAPSTGLETEIKHMCFSAGLRGVPRDSADKLSELVMGTIDALVRDGIPADEIETAVRSIDFANREVRRSGGPFALTLMRRSLRGWIHGLSPFDTLRYVPAFEEVKRRIAADPGYVRGLLRAWFSENAHRSLVSVYPDPEYVKRLDERLAARVRVFESALTPEGKAEFLSAQERFYALQKKPDDPAKLELIPHLSRSDLPVVADEIATEVRYAGKVPVLCHEQPTNGIAYVDIAMPVDALDPADYPLLPLYSSALTGMGLDGLAWPEVSALSARCTGGLGAMLFTSSPVPGSSMPDALPPGLIGRDVLILRLKMLGELSGEALSLAFRFLREADFSDAKRLTDILNEYRNDLDSSLAPSGHQYAVSRATSASGRSRAIDEIWNGLTQLRYVRDLCAKMKAPQAAETLASRLVSIRDGLASSGLVVNVTGTQEIIASLMKDLSGLLDGKECFVDARRHTASEWESTMTATCELVSANLQVGFAAAAIPSLPYGAPDQPVDTVLGNWLSNGILWERIRTTGGAYGAFAYPDSLEDVFVFSTYRDPVPVASLSVFRESLEAVASGDIDPIALEKTIIGCYSREIQPRSPSDKGFTAFIRIMYGISERVRLAKVARILSVSPEDLRACAGRLRDDWPKARGAVIGGKKQLKELPSEVFSGKPIRYTV